MSLRVDINKQLRDFPLEVRFETDGQTLGILGPSGCGKSMTLGCIAGVEQPDAGEITLGDRVLFDAQRRINLPPQKRHVGYLFQSYALFPNMTVAQNIRCVLRLPEPEAERWVTATLDRFGLGGLANSYPTRLSGGQQQRVALARMLASEPAAVLLDEPFSALDTHLREQMLIELRDALQGVGDVILVTHSWDEAYKLCDRLVIMEEGRLLAGGETRELFRDPGHLRVATLTGCRNLSRIEQLDGGRIRALDWGMTLEPGRDVPKQITHVGIRAQDWLPVHDPGNDEANLVKVRVLEQLESPFEWHIRFANAASPNPDAMEPMTYKVGKRQMDGPPAYLMAPPDSLLLLYGDESAAATTSLSNR